MLVLKRLLITVAAAAFVSIVPTQSSHAAMPVVDVGAIVQMVQQLRTLQQQLSTATDHLAQARDQFRSMTGGRGMERLLAQTARNYLPPDWVALERAVRQASQEYRVLADQIQQAVDANAVLTLADLDRLSPSMRALVEADRRSAAMLQVTSRQALATTSSRFTSIQQLIDAIPSATDQKAILDLQARIQAEQGMLANEQTKLEVLYQAAQAEELARKQRIRERAIAGIGSFRELPPLDLP